MTILLLSRYVHFLTFSSQCLDSIPVIQRNQDYTLQAISIERKVLLNLRLRFIEISR